MNFLFLLAIGISMGLSSFAFESPLRPRDLLDDAIMSRLMEAHSRPVFETVLHVKTARVAIADYQVLKRDFPELTAWSDEEIDAWLLQEGAWMAQSQVSLGSIQGIHDPIQTDEGVLRRAFRPGGYGRALMLSVKAPGASLETNLQDRLAVENDRLFRYDFTGLFDAKGVGAQIPTRGSHSNGVADLREMLQEFATEKLVHSLFKNSKEPYDTVESYAVLDLGFKMKTEFGEELPAAVILRQAHVRDWSANGRKVSIGDLHDRSGRSARSALKKCCRPTG